MVKVVTMIHQNKFVHNYKLTIILVQMTHFVLYILFTFVILLLLKSKQKKDTQSI